MMQEKRNIITLLMIGETNADSYVLVVWMFIGLNVYLVFRRELAGEIL